MFIHHPTQIRARRGGQALVEMAFVVTIMLGLALGLIQFALIANARMTLTNLAREGARYAAIHIMEGTSQTTQETSVETYIAGVADSTPLNSITGANISFSYPLTSGVRTQGQPIQVSVSYDMRSKFILPVSFPGLSRFGTSTTATATMIVQGT